ncbi:hypothetical protein QBC39DRAFT_35047 [Podospora conica]|nr:hypothetical protein QBC39DRAFT_35047 [Schizothecium conicum]
MAIFLDTPSITVMMEKFDNTIPVLMAALKDSEVASFEIIAERLLEPILRANLGRGGKPVEYHVPNMMVLACSMAIGHQAARDMAVSTGNQPSNEDILLTMDMFARLGAFVQGKLDHEMNKRFASITAATATSTTPITDALSTSAKASNIEGATPASVSTHTGSFFNIMTPSVSTVGFNTHTVNVVSIMTPSVGTSELEIIEHHDAETTTTASESAWDLV